MVFSETLSCSAAARLLTPDSIKLVRRDWAGVSPNDREKLHPSEADQ